jgi:hypothetical protein
MSLQAVYFLSVYYLEVTQQERDDSKRMEREVGRKGKDKKDFQKVALNQILRAKKKSSSLHCTALVRRRYLSFGFVI